MGKGNSFLDYLQYIDVPGWTFSSARFWLLRGTAANVSPVQETPASRQPPQPPDAVLVQMIEQQRVFVAGTGLEHAGLRRQ